MSSSVYARYMPIPGWSEFLAFGSILYIGFHAGRYADKKFTEEKNERARIMLNWSFNNPTKALTLEEWKWNSRVRPGGSYDLLAMQAESKLQRIQNLSKGPERIKRWTRNLLEFAHFYSKEELEDINHFLGYYLHPRDFTPILPRWRRSDYLLTSDLARQLMATGEGHQPKYEPDDILYGPGGPGFRTLINNLNFVHAQDSPVNLRRRIYEKEGKDPDQET